MRRAHVAALLLVLTLAACGTSSSSTPAGSVSPTPSAVPTSAATAAASAASAAPEPSAAVVATPAPSAMGLADWTATELFLLAGANPALRPTCGKAPKLPDGAYDGIQCHPAGISSIGLYAFDSREEARKLYFDRLAEYKVKPDSGDGGCPGENVDTPGNEGYELRIGCYVDEDGLANARMLFPGEAPGQSVYIGVVGKTDDYGDLITWLFPDYQPGATGCGWCIGGFWSAPGEYH
jgi:hypothetical protein